MTSRAAFTICSLNYYAQAITLAKSYKRYNPDYSFHIFIVDRKDLTKNVNIEGIEVKWIEELEIPNFHSYSFLFDVIELNTNVKPFCLLNLLTKYQSVLYIDPDIQIFDTLDSIYEYLNKSSIVVTPASLSPILDGHRPDDIEFLRVGAFNLGFIGVNNSDEGIRFCKWWRDRCFEYGYHDTQTGLFVDQKWINLAPCYFPSLKIIFDPGCNMAPWNIHERNLSKSDGKYIVNNEFSLKFFHFSSFDVNNPGLIAKRQTRYLPGTRPDLEEILNNYASNIRGNNYEIYSKISYGFDFDNDMNYISPTLRRIYANASYGFDYSQNPWNSDSDIMVFARKHKLIGSGIKQSIRLTAGDKSKYSKQEYFISIIFRFALKILGPNRYFILMRYLGQATSIRIQPKLF